MDNRHLFPLPIPLPIPLCPSPLVDLPLPIVHLKISRLPDESIEIIHCPMCLPLQTTDCRQLIH